MSLRNATFQDVPILRDVSSLNDVNVLASASSLGLAVFAFIIYRVLSPSNKGSIRELGGFPVFVAFTFFKKRYDFIWKHFNASPEPHFKFRVLQHSVVAVRGEEARKTFFDTKSLDFVEGYKILMGAAPMLRDISIEDTKEGDVSWFNKQIATLLNKNRLADALPSLLEDVSRRMDGWGKKGSMDPFRNIYDLVFQMTVRMTTCAELANDLPAMEEIQKLYWTLEKSATPTALLLPWFPSSSRKRKEAATKELFVKLYGTVEMRRHAAVPSTDAIDVLIAQGIPTENIVQFILGVIFAGLVNTGINACWALVLLAAHPEWKAKAKAEIQQLIEKHTDTLSSDPLHKRLSSIPVPAWEEEMPQIELIIRETIRLIVTGAALRRNLLESVNISGGTIEKGDFLTYSLGDVHLNPEIYSSPHEFDPARFSAGREEDKKAPFGFMGWGAGRHPCTGMKVAKLEMKVILALFLTAFDFDVVDKSGKHLTKLPQPDRNDIHQARPIGEPCFLKFERVVE